MPLPKINLDDKPYSDIVQEAIARIPAYSKNWTNFNPADPGITLIELFSWLVESQLYRLNKITDASRLEFLNLIGIVPKSAETLNDAIARAQRDFRIETSRAVTSDDFENLVMTMWQIRQLSVNPVARVKALPGYHPAKPNPVPGIVSLIVVPQSSQPKPISDPGLLKSIYQYLDGYETLNVDGTKQHFNGYRLLTAELFVMGPQYVDISISVHIKTLSTAVFDGPAGVQAAVALQLQNFLDPIKGGPNKTGWPFGRSVYLSEIYKVITGVSGVDYVEFWTKADHPALSRDDQLGGTLPNMSQAPKDTEGNVLLSGHALACCTQLPVIGQIV
jgi:hypothetical protein